MDKVREAVFSMIRDKIANSVVLDLYAGSGSFGLEAISEGAKICHFVDNSFNATRCIKRNLNKFKDRIVKSKTYGDTKIFLISK